MEAAAQPVPDFRVCGILRSACACDKMQGRSLDLARFIFRSTDITLFARLNDPNSCQGSFTGIRQIVNNSLQTALSENETQYRSRNGEEIE